MGTMPFHVEKGVLGLRFDYLTRSPAVRNHVYQRLMSGEDPFHVAGSIRIDGMEDQIINVFLDKKADFVAKLDRLAAVDPTAADPYERRSGEDYFADQARLMQANNDNTGNRNAFAAYWFQHRAAVTDTLRQVLLDAITSGKPHIDFWWECSQEDGEPPTVVLVETPGAAHVYFVTDHGPVEDPNTGTRSPIDPDPAGQQSAGGGHS